MSYRPTICQKMRTEYEFLENQVNFFKKTVFDLSSRRFQGTQEKIIEYLNSNKYAEVLECIKNCKNLSEQAKSKRYVSIGDKKIRFKILNYRTKRKIKKIEHYLKKCKRYQDYFSKKYPDDYSSIKERVRCMNFNENIRNKTKELLKKALELDLDSIKILGGTKNILKETETGLKDASIAAEKTEEILDNISKELKTASNILNKNVDLGSKELENKTKYAKIFGNKLPN